MTIAFSRHEQSADVSCDFCSFTDAFEEQNFADVVKAMKERGWRVFQDASFQWQHKCPCCLEKPAS